MIRATSLAATLAAAAFVLGGCGGEQRSTSPAGDSEPAAEEQQDLATLLATANTERGRRLYIQCRACHTLVADGNQLLGPNLRGFLNRPAGTAPGYDYSEALLAASLDWTPETLDEWIRNPTELIPGNKMIFAGIRRPRDRADLIAWLQTAAAEE
ncbi:c-type cytochrome [Candidatus Foliamicus sp.]